MSKSVNGKGFAALARMLSELKLFAKKDSLKKYTPNTENLSKLANACLNPKGGEPAARKNAAALGRMYMRCDQTDKETFLRKLSKDYDIDYENVRLIAKQCLAKAENDYLSFSKLSNALEPSRIRILRMFNELEDGLLFLIKMREHALNMGTQDQDGKKIAEDIKKILCMWFDVGLLDMKRITWNSSAALLEKLIKYEAVHAITSWNDLKNRLEGQRICFAFFHYKMLQEPLIFLEIALSKGLPSKINEIINDEPISDKDLLINNDCPDTAVFYSISNTQKGMQGISLGNFLIKRAVMGLGEEYPYLKRFATLSPIPSFSKWLKEGAKDDMIFKNLLHKIFGKMEESILLEYIDILKNLSQLPMSIKCCGQKTISILSQIIRYYLVNIKDRKNKAMDSVANFHLGNGAAIERINPLADLSEKGIDQSFGFMVNYEYDLKKIDDRCSSYAENGNVEISEKAIKEID